MYVVLATLDLPLRDDYSLRRTLQDNVKEGFCNDIQRGDVRWEVVRCDARNSSGGTCDCEYTRLVDTLFLGCSHGYVDPH